MKSDVYYRCDSQSQFAWYKNGLLGNGLGDFCLSELEKNMWWRWLSRFKTREVYDLIRQQFFALKKEHEKTLDLKPELQQKVISPQRALAMAKNIFVRGEFKRLREAIHHCKKDSQRLAQNLVSFSRQERNFKQTDWTIFPRAAFLFSARSPTGRSGLSRKRTCSAHEPRSWANARLEGTPLLSLPTLSYRSHTPSSWSLALPATILKWKRIGNWWANSIKMNFDQESAGW